MPMSRCNRILTRWSRLLLPLLLALPSCTKFLTVAPQGVVIPTTDEDFAAIVHTLVNDVEGGGDPYLLGNMETLVTREGCADDLDANLLAGTNLPAFAGEEINRRMTAWRDLYAIVRNCNIVIEGLSGRTSETARGALSAAYAMKGIAYYNLLREFCGPWQEGGPGLPLVEHFSLASRPLRASLPETREFIDRQFNAALQAGPATLFFFTEEVIRFYQVRLAFWCGDYDGVLALTEQMDLTPCPREDFAAMLSSTAPGGELIARSHINDASELGWYFGYLKTYLESRPAATAFVRLFGDEPARDIRFTTGLDARRFGTKPAECRLRRSELLLMAAESRYHTGRPDLALGLLNTLRRNRIEDAVDLTEATLPPVREGGRIRVDARGNALTPLLQAIFDERRKELFLEGDRWFELKRNGRPAWWVIAGGLKYTTEPYLYTSPIYIGDIDLLPEIGQNPGYVPAGTTYQLPKGVLPTTEEREILTALREEYTASIP